MHRVALAVTENDPAGRLYGQAIRLLPRLLRVFGAVCVQATVETSPRSVEALRAAGVLVRQHATDGHLRLGRARRAAVELGLQLGSSHVLFCDFDRVLHWAEFHLDELEAVAARLPEHDFTVLGRTARAFDTHPRVQRDTESIVNTVYATVSGNPWDITSAARGISPRAAEALLAGCPDESIGTDASWPLFIQRAGGFTLGYIATEGLEWETPDRFRDEIDVAGGLDAWLALIDADPRNWAQRLEMARIEVEATLPYAAGGERPDVV